MTGKELFGKYKSLLLFALFGGIATVIETALYALFFEYLLIPNVIATFLAWFLVVFFCFYSYKFLVYKEKSTDSRTVLLELLSFFLLRSSTGILNMVAMVIFVDVLHLNPVLMKVLTCIVLGFANYLIGRIAIFAEKKA
ncbi:MAG: GtrA family protein [Spirochaetales bacterium]|nr:GtrA family protein [Candidatus Physcosoma equi]